MSYGTVFNRTLVSVKIKADTIQSSPARRRSPRGEPEYIEFDLTDLMPYVLHTWADFEVGRRQEIQQTNIDIMGVWEPTAWIQDRVAEAIGRELRVGDQVKFDNEDPWFLLGRGGHDEGIFTTVPTRRFNLLRSNKP